MNKKNPLLIYKSIFISDAHLGTKGCQVDKLFEFFKNSRSENLYSFGIAIPLISVTVRRIHDIGHSVFIILLFVVGFIVSIILRNEIIVRIVFVIFFVFLVKNQKEKINLVLLLKNKNI